jgi:hypothetical protein
MGSRFRYEPKTTLQKVTLLLKHPRKWRAKITPCISILEDEPEIGPNTFLTVSADYEQYRSVNLTNVAVIEVPVEAYLAHIARDAEED